MSVRVLKDEKGIPYFCTITNKSWLPLFEICQFQDKIYAWFDYLKNNNHDVLAYVIMPNHLHLIMHVDQNGSHLNKLIGEAKRLMSYAMAARLKKIGQSNILESLSYKVSGPEKNKGVKHKFFEDSFDGKTIITDKFLYQKLQYIHDNPVRRNLANKPKEFLHSSALYYATGHHSAYEVTHYVKKYFSAEEFEFNKKLWWGI